MALPERGRLAHEQAEARMNDFKDEQKTAIADLRMGDRQGARGGPNWKEESALESLEEIALATEDQRAVLEAGVGGARNEVMQAIAEAGPESSPLVRLRAALGAHLKYTLRQHFSSRLKSIRRLPKRLRERHMQQERDYAAIFAGLLSEAEKQGLLRSGFDLSVVRMLALGALTWVAEWYDPAGPMTPDDVADELLRVLTGGIAKKANGS